MGLFDNTRVEMLGRERSLSEDQIVGFQVESDRNRIVDIDGRQLVNIVGQVLQILALHFGYHGHNLVIRLIKGESLSVP